jgi:uncharacterized membrane protein YhaH (DUF805 family)
MISRKEFWFAITFFILAIVPILAINSIDEYGQFMIAISQKMPKYNSGLDKFIYQNVTRPYYLMIGAVSSWFILFGTWQALLLIKRARTYSVSKYSLWIFIIGFMPVLVVVFRALINAYSIN